LLNSYLRVMHQSENAIFQGIFERGLYIVAQEIPNVFLKISTIQTCTCMTTIFVSRIWKADGTSSIITMNVIKSHSV